MRVLVTGGAGYIGSITVAHLLARGWEVEIIDNFSTGHKEALPPDVVCHEGDIANAALLERVFRSPFEAVLHFAAFSLVEESVREPLKYYRNNMGGTLTLLNQVAAGGARRFVFSSSAAIYGEPSDVPIDESAPLAPVNPYGRTKLAMEGALADAAQAAGFAAVALRYFNAAGASHERGEDHRPESHLIPRLLLSLLVPAQEFQIFGDDYDTPDGTCIRDYIHVTDLAEAHAAALTWAQKPGFTAINLGTSRGLSVRQIVTAASQVTGRPLDPLVSPRRPGDPARLVAANGLAQSLLGWQPTRSDLTTILSDAWGWHQAHPQGYSR